MSELKEKGCRRICKKPLEHWHLISGLMMLLDFVAIHAAYFLALWLRFDFHFSAIPEEYLNAYKQFITWYALGCLVLFFFTRLYRSIWRFASYVELFLTLGVSLLASVLHALLITLLILRMPLSYYALEAPLSGSGETLADVLQDKGVFTRQEWRSAQATEVGPRF